MTSTDHPEFADYAYWLGRGIVQADGQREPDEAPPTTSNTPAPPAQEIQCPTNSTN